MTSVSNLDSDELFALAKLDVAAEKLCDGLIKLKEARQREDCPVDVLAEIGRLYAKLELRQRAKDAFKSYLEANPDAVLERFQLGMLDFESDAFPAAIEQWKAVLQLDEHYPPALFYCGLALTRLGDIESAKTCLNQLKQNVEESNLYFQKATELVAKIEGQSADISHNPVGAKH